ncbi:polysaccharide pyruvyl transferase family protein [Methylobacter sp.]|uniref:polysaccharide pyruvyl transferase family protein n=1 Tax=Methylobacter sp. TaxID=2051955 RepID=UPI003DA44992
MQMDKPDIRRPKILIDNSGYELRNMGDVAMLVVAVQRIYEMYPDADLHIFTTEVDRLKKFVPGVKPVTLKGRRTWGMAWNILGGIHKLIPQQFHHDLLRLEQNIKINRPLLAKRWITFRLTKRGYDLSAMHQYLELVENADIVIATGGGFITDPFQEHAMQLLQTMAIAKHQGKPIAMFGQGLGPAESLDLLYWAKNILPKLSLLTLREQKNSLPFALRAGAEKSCIQVTGDDAVTLANSFTPERLGRCIGVNLRVATYSGVQQGQLNVIRNIFSQAGNELDAKLVPVPISFHDGDSDLASLKVLLGEENIDDSLDEAENIIKQVGRCRIVVTGSYHAGVFALSQGISVVGVASSDYYRHKFEGLADQFGGGCFIVDVEKTGFAIQLLQAIKSAWDNAELERDRLLAAASEQIQKADSAYLELKKIIEEVMEK